MKVERFGAGTVASVAPAVTTGGGGGEGGVTTAGRVEGGPLKDGDLSLGFGYTPRVPVSLSDAVPPGSHPGLWGRPTATYSFRDAGVALGVGLAGTQREIFRDILSRNEEFGPAYAEVLKLDSERERAIQQQQQHHQQHHQQQHHQQHHQQHQHQQQQHHQQHQHHQHQQQSLQGVQRQVNIVGEGPNYGDTGRGEGESSSSGSVDKGGHQGGQAGMEPWAARTLRDDVVRVMDVQPLNEQPPSRQTLQHNPQAAQPNVDAVPQVHQLQLGLLYFRISLSPDYHIPRLL